MLLHLEGKRCERYLQNIEYRYEEYNADKLNNYFKQNLNVTYKRYVSKQVKQDKDKKVFNKV